MRRCFGLYLKYIMFLFMIAAAVTACAPDKTPANNPAKNPVAPEKIEPYRYQSRAVYIKEPEGRILVVLENGKVIEADEGEASPAIVTGCEAYVDVHVDEFGRERVAPKYPLSYSVKPLRIPVISDAENAPGTFALNLLDNLLYNGTEEAIAEYRLNQTTVLARQNAGRIDFAMNFDVKPCRNSFLFWRGLSDADGFVKDLNCTLSIFGANNLWLTLDTPYLYTDISYMSRHMSSEYFIQQKDQSFLYASKDFTYYSQRNYLPQKAEDKQNGASVEYLTAIWSLNHQTGERKALWREARNTDFAFADDYNNNIYFTSFYWLPYSESFAGPILCIQEETQKCVKVLEPGRWLSAVEDTAYVVLLSFTDTLCSIDLDTGEQREICKLPQRITEGNPLVLRNIIHGKMNIAYIGFDNSPWLYEIDLVNGNIEQKPSGIYHYDQHDAKF